MKNILVSAAALVAVAAPLAVALPASADTPGCVTRTEFRSILAGATRAHVSSVFDTSGTVTYQYSSSGYAEQDREYRSCTHPSYSTVEVDFEWRNGAYRETSKYAYWG